ncbi:integrin alpha-V-like [Lethenteron reissneri]|uniref:integrin alpha-V-like n=1 Tax=Lethenteron reissneri TaxID=7753 RepID=UPI002AB7281D|nr:integrin alpha-V-like [Lethenteron reissneri]
MEEKEKTLVKNWLSEFKGLPEVAVAAYAERVQEKASVVPALYSAMRDMGTELLEPICHQLFEFIRSGEAALHRFALQFVPELIWRHLSAVARRDKPSQGSVEALLLGIYNLETVDDEGKPKVLSFTVPSLSKSSIYHEPCSIGSLALTEEGLSQRGAGKAVYADSYPQRESITAQNSLTYKPELSLSIGDRARAEQVTQNRALVLVSTDLLVGAFGVSKAVLYRARPVVILDVELQLLPQMINTESKDCKMPGSGAPVSCFTVKVCLSAVGKSVPATMEVDFQVQLDRLKLKGSGRRALFLLSQTSLHEQRLSLANRARPHCVALLAFLRGESEFRDKLTPISVGLNLSLDEQARRGPHGLHPVLHPYSPQHVSKQAYILLDCGEDNVCIPKLKLSVTWDRKALLVGEENLVTLALVARNAGEGAYEAELVLVLPPEADYVGIVRNESLTLLSCSYKAENASRSVLCDLGNPMAGQSSIALGLRFSVKRLEQAGPNVTFEVHVRRWEPL